MSDEQKPFITSDGKLSTEGHTSAAKLLASVALKAQVDELVREQQMRGRLYPGWISNGRLDEDRAIDQLRALGRAIESLQLLQEPSVNTTVVAMKQVDPTLQALISDIATELSQPSTARQKLANDLRKRLRGAP